VSPGPVSLREWAQTLEERWHEAACSDGPLPRSLVESNRDFIRAVLTRTLPIDAKREAECAELFVQARKLVAMAAELRGATARNGELVELAGVEFLADLGAALVEYFGKGDS
jgi:hypothetical protein